MPCSNVQLILLIIYVLDFPSVTFVGINQLVSYFHGVTAVNSLCENSSLWAKFKNLAGNS